MNKKKLGAGSISLLLVILALIWSCNIKWLDNFCLGDYILNTFNIPSWSNGTNGIHYTIFYSYIFLIPAAILGVKKKDDLFATVGKWLSITLMILFIIACFFMV